LDAAETAPEVHVTEIQQAAQVHATLALTAATAATGFEELSRAHGEWGAVIGGAEGPRPWPSPPRRPAPTGPATRPPPPGPPTPRPSSSAAPGSPCSPGG